MSLAGDLYLDLLKRTLCGMTYEDPPLPLPGPDPDPASYHQALRDARYHRALRTAGADVPQHAPCMIGTERLDNVQRCVEAVLGEGIPGDLAEAGVGRGGTVIFLRALLKLHGIANRSVWAIDSFAGLPTGLPEEAFLAVPLDEVRHNFGLYGMLDDQVRFLPGWFRDTLPDAPVGQLAVLRLDADLYESQLTALTHLYPKLSPGGYVIIDDCHLAPCGQAVTDYREQQGITAPVTVTGDGYALHWRKEEEEESGEHPA